MTAEHAVSLLLGFLLAVLLMLVGGAVVLWRWRARWWWRTRPWPDAISPEEQAQAGAALAGVSAGAEPTVGPFTKTLSQDEYAELLTTERARTVEDFSAKDSETFVCKRCGAPASMVRVAHPIWDGPFPEAGSGVVDVRVFPTCPTCDVKRVFDASPIRLPWLDSLPLALRDELFEREAFHRLLVKVTRYRPPAARVRCVSHPDCRWEGAADSFEQKQHRAPPTAHLHYEPTSPSSEPA